MKTRGRRRSSFGVPREREAGGKERGRERGPCKEALGRTEIRAEGTGKV